jgi:16S rRNA A1518/A1519 N6-dimethyltransferase RsmA/KsgA/DIM1 with predicted DNA glycosylase/AP lyase activity
MAAPPPKVDSVIIDLVPRDHCDEFSPEIVSHRVHGYLPLSSKHVPNKKGIKAKFE